MANTITITNVQKGTGNSYDVFFESNFVLNSLSLEYSPDGINWFPPILLSGITSPQTAIVPLQKSFAVRISNEEAIPVKRFNNKFNSKFF